MRFRLVSLRKVRPEDVTVCRLQVSCCILSCLAVTCLATSATAVGAPFAHAALQTRNPIYRVAPSDDLAVFPSPAPELNQKVTVQTDGFITLRIWVVFTFRDRRLQKLLKP